jgi:hypothetical protein
MPLDAGNRSLLDIVHPGDGGQESFTTQYFIFRLPAWLRMSSAVTMELPPPSLAAMPEQ